jgi:hypothetical protein
MCAITGESGDCVPRWTLLGKSFTGLDLLRAPQSGFVSLDAWITLSHKWERMSSWFCDGKSFVRLKRAGVRELVVAGKYPPMWAGYATTSYKKHGALLAPVNTGARAVWRFENLNADCSDHARLVEIWKKLNAALEGGIGRRNMETLEPDMYLLSRVDLKTWLDFRAWAIRLYGGGLYQFLCYLLPSKEERSEKQN